VRMRLAANMSKVLQEQISKSKNIIIKSSYGLVVLVVV
jgi:hypothetical protein